MVGFASRLLVVLLFYLSTWALLVVLGLDGCVILICFCRLLGFLLVVYFACIVMF